MEFGPGEAAGGSQRGQAAAADFKVLVWYRRDDALGTFKYQIYDLRKGEYSAAVDAWIKDIPAKYPAYIVLVRDVDLRREKGETEMLKVGSVIKRELMVAAAMSGVALGEGLTNQTGRNLSGTKPGTQCESFARSSPELIEASSTRIPHLSPSPYLIPVLIHSGPGLEQSGRLGTGRCGDAGKIHS